MENFVCACGTGNRGTLRTLLLRAHTICSDEKHLKKEIEHLKYAFTVVNGYPFLLWYQVLDKITEDLQSVENPVPIQPVTEPVSNIESMIMLPYQGPQGDKLLMKLRRTIQRVDKNHLTKVVYTGTKLSTQFPTKDQTIKEHKNNLVYKVECPEIDCNKTYIGETSRRINERVKEHCGKDPKSHVVTHTMESGHNAVTINDFTILYNKKQLSNYYKRKTTEALAIKKLKPSLNAQEK